MKKNLMPFMLTLFLFGTGLIAQGQTSSKACCSDKTEKSGCSPGSCGPHNTKTEESVAVTKLRQDLQTNLNLLKKSKVNINTSFKNLKLAKGNNEEESLLIIMSTLISLKAEIIEKTPSAKILPEFKANSNLSSSSKREMMIFLIKQNELLEKQIKMIL